MFSRVEQYIRMCCVIEMASTTILHSEHFSYPRGTLQVTRTGVLTLNLRLTSDSPEIVGGGMVGAAIGNAKEKVRIGPFTDCRLSIHTASGMFPSHVRQNFALNLLLTFLDSTSNHSVQH